MIGEAEHVDHSRTVPIMDDELLRRAVKTARARARGYSPRWAAVMDAFMLGSTYAHALCRRFDFDPDEMVRR